MPYTPPTPAVRPLIAGNHTGDDWEKRINEFAGSIKKTFGHVLQAISWELYDRIMEKNPVLTGRSKNSWRITVGTPSQIVPPEFPHFGPAPKAEDTKIDGTQTVYIVNNQDYIHKLEEGFSKKAPAGMVRISILSLQLNMDTVVEEGKRMARAHGA